MSEWKEVKLGDAALINPRETLPKGTKAAKVAMEVLQPFTKRPSSFSYEDFKGGMKFRNGDTIVARITPCLENGKTAYIDFLKDNEIGFGSTEYIVIREKSKITDKQYLYYLAISPDFRDVAILSMTGSSGRQRVQLEVIKNYTFLLPPLSEQRAIAGVLGSLDAKIDLLHRQNATLESLAQTLFRQWFIEEADEDWEEGVLGDYVILNRRNITKSQPHNIIKYLDTGSLNSGKIEKLEPYDIKDAPSRAKRLVKHNDILISTVRPNQKHYGIIKNPPDNLIVSTGFCTITCNKIDPYFVYLLLTSNEMTEYLHSIAEGSTSTYPSLKPSDIGTISFLLPPKDKLAEFSAIVDNFWKKISSNTVQIRTLENLRDALLPKLMSSEVKVLL